jgi:hypothetical protein
MRFVQRQARGFLKVAIAIPHAPAQNTGRVRNDANGKGRFMDCVAPTGLFSFFAKSTQGLRPGLTCFAPPGLDCCPRHRRVDTFATREESQNL